MAGGAVIMVMIVFFAISFEIYYWNKDTFLLNMNDCFSISVKNINSKAIEKGCQGVVTSKNDSSFLIIRQGKIHVQNYDHFLNINDNFFRALYDIRNLEFWKLERLGEYLREEIKEQCPPFELILKDSLGHPIDHYIYYAGRDKSIRLDQSYTLLLGFLDKHQLKIRYTYPWSFFWKAEGKKLLVIFVLLALVTTCIGLFLRLLWNARRKAANQELFAQALNHDLKSPIATLRLKTYQMKLASKESYTKEQEKLYRDILQQIATILASADQVLQDSIDEKGISLKPQWINIRKMIDEQVDIVLSAGENKKQVDLHTFYQLSDPVIFADPTHISRVILNLLDNAVKYSDEKVAIRITCREERKYVSIIFQDDGHGIAKKDLKHIFEKNFRSRTDAQGKKVKGYGIGLSYVKTVVHLHRGKIKVESEVGKGTTFIIKLRNERKD